MIKVENIEVFNFEGAVRGMRLPMNSGAKSDSKWVDDPLTNLPVYQIGKNDLDLMRRLYKAGTEHRKYLRQIFVSMDITASMFWWREMDTYKIGTTANSTSFMHKGLAKEFEPKDFAIIFDTTNSDLFYDVPSEIKEEDEIWKTIPDYEDYEVSNTSKIRVKDKEIVDVNGFVRHYKGHELIQSVNSSNYKKVILITNKNGRIQRDNKYVHRLIAECFIPNPLNYSEVNHIDGNKYNNNINNLEWVSKKMNAQHAFDNDLRNISQYNKYKMSNLTTNFSTTDIITIYKLYELGLQKKEIAKIFGCYDSRICELLNNKTYLSRSMDRDFTYMDTIKIIIDELNTLRQLYLEEEDAEEKKEIWRKIIHILPQSYLYRRTVTMNYENVVNMIHQRSDHKLSEWREFTDILKDLPYVREIMED